MLSLVRIALARPYTFIVLALLILLSGTMAVLNTPTDIFPDIKIPVIAVVWQYAGLSPDQMTGRIISPYERVLTTTVNNVQHIESKSINGFGIVKIFFQPTVDIATANAQVTAISQTMLKQLPPGITPPMILNYNASTVPILQLALSGKGLSQQQLSDLGLNMLRPQLISVPGAAIPYPSGGKSREVEIDINPQALQSLGLSAQDVANALAAQNLILPVGTEKIGKFEYDLQLNDAPGEIRDLSDLPIRAVNGTMIYIHDVATVHDGSPPQTNIVHVNGHRSVLMSILKSGSASTLAIVAGIKQRLRQAKAGLPGNLRVTPIGDQSVFVRAAISGVAREGIIAAALTSLMILLFLGSWRSTLIITLSIPLSVLGSIVALSLAGQTLNIMTLGGLALAVGILVDDATVTIENINWHLEHGKDVRTAILDGARQIVTPAFVSLLCICIAFVPMFFLAGVAHFLFVPMAEAVIFALITSFLLSRTLVPTLAMYLLEPHAAQSGAAPSGAPEPSRNPLARFQRAFDRHFGGFRESYRALLSLAIENQWAFVAGFLGFVLLSFALVPMLGRNFFPSVDSGQILMHVRAPIGTRIEQTSELFARVESDIRRIIPARELAVVVDNIGLSNAGINNAYENTGTIGEQDGDIEISLGKDHRPTAGYVRAMRAQLPREFPGVTFSFPPADMVSQILNFGSPAPIDLQVRGRRLSADFVYANRLLRRIKRVPGIADARVQESRQYPTFRIDMDRTQAQLLGISARDITDSLVVNLAGSSQIAPTFWLDPANGVSYPVVMQTPQYSLDSLAQLRDLPVRGSSGEPQVLGGLATLIRSAGDAVVDQYNLLPVVQIYATTQGRDLGSVAAAIRTIVVRSAGYLPKGSVAKMLGQVDTMNRAFSGLILGLAGAVLLIYLLLVVNFHSWTDALVIVTALPAALAGIVWMLFATHTTLSVPALTGAIMCMGIATANSVLVVSFCRERLAAHGDPVRAAIEGGHARFRPVLMTALAMIIGMAPMALALGEGGEQNAPLGRAVIGGLIFATAATLFLVPAMFRILHGLRTRAPGCGSDRGESAHA
ncbi:MAG TPA: efflux RND transporter permease subunit [Steroidobacteraceae bacterium]|nr:efflux RND transporter permease subunit [Steroidobacteraceae bacterium]